MQAISTVSIFVLQKNRCFRTSVLSLVLTRSNGFNEIYWQKKLEGQRLGNQPPLIKLFYSTAGSRKQLNWLRVTTF